MLLARVIGHATSTIKHRSLEGWKLMLVQPVNSLTLEPVITIDELGAAVGDLVMISSDGKGTRETLGDDTSPARWTVLGIVEHAPLA